MPEEEPALPEVAAGGATPAEGEGEAAITEESVVAEIEGQEASDEADQVSAQEASAEATEQ